MVRLLCAHCVSISGLTLCLCVRCVVVVVCWFVFLCFCCVACCFACWFLLFVVVLVFVFLVGVFFDLACVRLIVHAPCLMLTCVVFILVF